MVDRGGDVPRHDEAESTGAAGDEVDAALPPGPRHLPEGGLGQAADHAATVAVAHLRLEVGGRLGREAGGDGGGRDAVRALHVLGVQQRVLQVGGTQHSGEAAEAGRLVAGGVEGDDLEQGGSAYATCQEVPGQGEQSARRVGEAEVQGTVDGLDDGAVRVGGQCGPQGVAVAVGHPAEHDDVPFGELLTGRGGCDVAGGPLGPQQHDVAGVAGGGPVRGALGVEVEPAAFACEGVAGQADAARGRAGAAGLLPFHVGAAGPQRQERLVLPLLAPGGQGGAYGVAIGGPVRAGGAPGPVSGCGGVGDEGREPFAALGEGGRGEGEPLLKGHAPGLQGPGDGREGGVGQPVEPAVQSVGLLDELGLAHGGQHDQGGPGGGGLGAGRRPVFGDDDVGVGTAAAEAGDSGDPGQGAPHAVDVPDDPSSLA